MSELTKIASPLFGTSEIDFWQNENGDIFMTSEQLGMALGYAYPAESIRKIRDRFPERFEEKSVQVVLTSTDGKHYATRVYNESGIYEVIRKSNQPKADEFYDWVYKVLSDIRKGSNYVDVSRLSPEMQMFHHMFQSVAKTQLELTETKKQLADVTQTIETIQDTFLQRDEDWRKSINSMLNGAAFRSDSDYRNLRTESYRLLEERAHCDLGTRLRNLTKRLEDSGATKTQIKEANRMDLIESDPRLKEIYATIVKEMSIGSLKQVK